MLQRTLLLAQRAADDAVNEAQARARQLLEESEAKAQSLVSDAEATARRIAEGERRRLEAEILDLSARREQLRADADALDAYASGYRDRIRTIIESDLENLGRNVDPPAPRPDLHEVELPPERDTAPVAAIERAEPERESPEAAILDVVEDQSTWDPGPDTRALGTIDAPSGAPAAGGPFAMDASSASPVAAPPRPMPAATPTNATAASEWPPHAPAPEASAAAAPAAESGWLSSEEEWAPAEQSWDAPAPWERDP